MANEILAAVVGGIAGGLAGAVLGYFSARGANTANRKGVRLDQRLDMVDNSLELLTREAIAYWRTSSKDLAAESRIKSLIEELGIRIHNLGGFGVSLKIIEDAQLLGEELADLITGGDFESENRQADDGKLESIRALQASIGQKFHPHRR